MPRKTSDKMMSEDEKVARAIRTAVEEFGEALLLTLWIALGNFEAFKDEDGGLTFCPKDISAEDGKFVRRSWGEAADKLIDVMMED